MLKVTVMSFSFKRGLPDDPTGNGGGFVFDCRAMPNPFWDETMREYTGRDKPVTDFFDRFPETIGPFIDAAETLVLQAVEQYRRDGRDISRSPLAAPAGSTAQCTSQSVLRQTSSISPISKSPSRIRQVYIGRHPRREAEDQRRGRRKRRSHERRTVVFAGWQ